MDAYQHLSKRDKTRWKSRLVDSFDSVNTERKIFLLGTCSDEGVAKNGGRIGARFAPEALANKFFGQLVPWQIFGSEEMAPQVVASLSGRGVKESDESQRIFTEFNRLKDSGYSFRHDLAIHLGGGHDTIYPYLISLMKSFPDKRFIVVNIDPHTDSRVDDLGHSGNPFRRAYKEAEKMKVELSIIQIETDRQANTWETLNSVPMTFLNSFTELDELAKSFDSKRDFVLLSLDCDVINSSLMGGVSATNPFGMYMNRLMDYARWFAKLPISKAVGIYEYNPLYDGLSADGAKIIARFLNNIVIQSTRT